MNTFVEKSSGTFFRLGVILGFFLLLFLPSFTHAAGIFSTIESTTSEQRNEAPSLFQTITQIQNQNQHLLEQKIALENEKKREFQEEESKIQNLNKELQKIEEKKGNGDLSSSEKEVIQKKEEDINFQILETSNILNEKIDLHLQKIRDFKQALQEGANEIQKLNELAKQQAVSLSIKIGIFIGFLLVFFFLRFLAAKAINNLTRIPLQRRRVLCRLNRIVFNSIITIFILVAVFSQLVSLIPLLAILGTALAFALRDIISSFIAWFLIGSSEGYKVGDLIEVDELRGRVIEIHPFLTVVRQTGLRGDSGKISSFPNKKIFESSIQNFSKMYRFTFVMVDFLIEQKSNIEEARDIFLRVMREENKSDCEEAEKNIPNLQSKFGITREQIDPQVFIEPDPKGILLRGKFFCRLENRHKNRTAITKRLLEEVQQRSDISLRFVQLGDSQ